MLGPWTARRLTPPMLERRDGAPPAGISGLDPMLLREPPEPNASFNRRESPNGPDHLGYANHQTLCSWGGISHLALIRSCSLAQHS
jgi:hypothetical protein